MELSDAIERITDLSNANDLLLTRYMHHVMDCESVSFVDRIIDNNSDQPFTERELEKLKDIDKQYKS